MLVLISMRGYRTRYYITQHNKYITSVVENFQQIFWFMTNLFYLPTIVILADLLCKQPIANCHVIFSKMFLYSNPPLFIPTKFSMNYVMCVINS